MPYTLADYARVQKDPLKAGVVDIFRRESFMMEYLKWQSIDTLATQTLRTKSLPTPQWRMLNSGWVHTQADLEPVEERLFELGGMIDVDRLLVEAASVINQRAYQTESFTTAVAYSFNETFIDGDPLVDPNTFAGLRYRIARLPTTQTILAGGLDISPGGLAADQVRLVDLINEGIHTLDGHKGDCILVNSNTYLRMLAAIRDSGFLATTQDSYARTIYTWGEGGPKILDLGVARDGESLIIGNAETEDGSGITGDVHTSIYMVKLGEKYLSGIQLRDLEVRDMGLLEDGVTFRTVLDWPVGLHLVNPRSLVRIVGLISVSA